MLFFEKLKKWFTGAKKTIVILVISCLIGGVSGFYINSYLTEIHKVSDVEFMLGPLDKDGMGYYFPLKIINSGGRDLEDIRIRFQNDYMDHYMEYHIPKLIPTQLEVIKLRDKSTILMHTKKTCGPDEEIKTEGFKIQVLRINETIPYIPPQTGSIYLCDFISYNATVLAKNFEKKIEGRFYAPRKIPLKFTPDEILDIRNQNVSIDSPIELSDYSGQELAIYNKTSFSHNLECGPYLPCLPCELSISFKNYSNPVNITIDYLEFPQFSIYS